MVEVWGGRGDSSTPSGVLESDMDEGKGRKGRREGRMERKEEKNKGTLSFLLKYTRFS